MSMTLASYYFNQFTTAQYADFCIRLVVAFLVGGMVGLERSKRFKEAGIHCGTDYASLQIRFCGFESDYRNGSFGK